MSLILLRGLGIIGSTSGYVLHKRKKRERSKQQREKRRIPREKKEARRKGNMEFIGITGTNEKEKKSRNTIMRRGKDSLF